MNLIEFGVYSFLLTNDVKEHKMKILNLIYNKHFNNSSILSTGNNTDNEKYVQMKKYMKTILKKKEEVDEKFEYIKQFKYFIVINKNRIIE